MGRVLGVVCILLLGACAGGMDAAECQTADWRAIGTEDGALGQTLGGFSERRKACAEHGVVADFEAYRAGRSDGLAEFCRPYNGYRLGAQGRHYHGVCPAGLEGEFLAAHSDGYGLYQRQAALKGIGKRLYSSRERSHEIERLIAEKTALLVSGDTPVAERATLAVEIKQLAEEKGQLYASIYQLELDHAEAEQDYARYQERMATRPRS